MTSYKTEFFTSTFGVCIVTMEWTIVLFFFLLFFLLKKVKNKLSR